MPSEARARHLKFIYNPQGCRIYGLGRYLCAAIWRWSDLFPNERVTKTYTRLEIYCNQAYKRKVTQERLKFKDLLLPSVLNGLHVRFPSATSDKIHFHFAGCQPRLRCCYIFSSLRHPNTNKYTRQVEQQQWIVSKGMSL